MPEIAIDACVFIHLLNPQWNLDSHIDKLLRLLFNENFMLLVDSTGRIGKDYQSRVIPMIKEGYETGTQLFLLRQWMQSERRTMVDLVSTDHLMTAIKRVIHERDEHADRALVYVVCKKNSILVTNDDIHILNRRADLLKKTKRERGCNTEILSSYNAFTKFQGTGGVA